MLNIPCIFHGQMRSEIFQVFRNWTLFVYMSRLVGAALTFIASFNELGSSAETGLLLRPILEVQCDRFPSISDQSHNHTLILIPSHHIWGHDHKIGAATSNTKYHCIHATF
jgi:hypothetical protein